MTHVIGEREFRTRAAALSFVQQILHSVPLDSTLGGADLRFLLALFARHPEAAEKFGPGIVAVEVRTNPVFRRNRCFWITRTDGTDTDISFLECLRPTPHNAKVRAALRAEVAHQVIAFRDQQFARGPVVCPITGAHLTATTCHVDHYDPTFVELADTFAEGVGGYAAITLHQHGDRRISDQLADSRRAEAWRSLHQEQARLRVVSVAANLSLLRRTMAATR